MTGGLAVLYQLAERLRETGRECVLVSSGEAPGLAERSEERVKWSADGSFLCRDDVYVTPEGWPNALAPGFAAGCRCLVYVQNWAYMLSGLPAGVHWSRLPVRFLAVSHPVAWFVQTLAKLPVMGVIRPALDVERFKPGNKAGKTLRIAWMPRKNKALAEQIRAIAEAALAGEAAPPLEWVELHRMSQEDVAGELGRSHIFLCTGFPEGFGLPPLEAMASGCLTAGFSGFGGWDYMREARDGFLPLACPPGFTLRDVPWGGNGFFAADGDVISAALALKEAVTRRAASDSAAIIAAGLLTAHSYSQAAQRRELESLWKILDNEAWEKNTATMNP